MKILKNFKKTTQAALVKTNQLKMNQLKEMKELKQ